jgi:membrane protease subunit (stomatin/prohibitin family)
MQPFKAPVSIDIPTNTVVNIMTAAATALGANPTDIQAVQIDLPKAFTGALHPWCQTGSQADGVTVADVRKMTEYNYVKNNPLQFAMGEKSDLLVCTDAGTAGTTSVMVTLWV